jgi:hypothetical protein
VGGEARGAFDLVVAEGGEVGGDRRGADALVEPGEGQQRGEQPVGAGDLAHHVGEQAVAGLGVVLAEQRLDGAAARGERGAQLVGGVGEEAAAGGLGGLGVGEGGLERVEHPVVGGRHAPEPGGRVVGLQPLAEVAGGGAVGGGDDGVERGDRVARRPPEQQPAEQQREGRAERAERSATRRSVVSTPARDANTSTVVPSASVTTWVTAGSGRPVPRAGGLAPAPGAVGTEVVVCPSGVVTSAGMPRACRAVARVGTS